jgi:outer membrane receptor protein involved in Fe transport
MKFSRVQLIVFFCFCFQFYFIDSFINCQQIFIKGNVVDAARKNISGAKITFISNSKQVCLSDSLGFYFLKVNQKNGKLVANYFEEYSDTIFLKDSNFDALSNEITINLKINSSEKELQTVTINVGKFDRPIEEQTVSLEIIKPRLIENKNTRSIETILDLTPGLNILDGEPQIRGGSGFTFGVGSKVAVVVDDMPMLSGDAGRPEWGFIPVENIHQIEIIKGASSVLFGSAALSGSIHIRTAYPTLKPLTKVTLYSGYYSKPEDQSATWWKEFPLISGANFLHSRKIKNIDFVFGMNLNYDHGYMGPPITDSIVATMFPDTISNFTEKQLVSKKVRINFSIRNNSKNVRGLSYGLNGNFMLSQSNLVFAWLNDTSGIYRAYPGAVFLQNQHLFNVDPFINYVTKNKGKHSLKTRFLYVDNDLSANQSNQAQNYYGDYSYKLSNNKYKNLDVITGISGIYTQSFASIFSGSGSPSNDLMNLSLYSQVENKFFSRLKVSLGARLEYFELNDSINSTKPIFRGGLNFKVFKGTFLRTSFGQGYRFPTITERFIKTGVGNMGVFPNQDLKAETSWNAELGIKQLMKWNGLLAIFDVAGFWQEYQNTIEYIFGIWSPLTTPQDLGKSAGFKFLNTGKSRVLGFDLSLSGKYDFSKKSNMVFLLGYNYILPVTLTPDYIYATDSLQRKFSYNSTSLDSTNSILKYRFLHNIKADVEFVIHDFSIGLSAKYFSKMENMDAVIKDFEKMTNDVDVLQNIRYMDFYSANRKGIWIFDARIAYQMHEKHKISLVSSNFMNKTYSLRPLKIEAPRIIMLQYVLTL